MSTHISNVDEIKTAVPMEDVVSCMLGVRLDHHGRGPCPIHSGKKRNFSVRNNVAHCWSQCGRSWDTIGLVMEAYSLSFTDAIKKLAQFAGITVRYSDGRKEAHNFRDSEEYRRVYQPPAPLPVDIIPWNVVSQSFKRYADNNFYRFLSHIFTEGEAQRLSQLFHLGTSKYKPGANIFWQIDHQGQVRTGKIMVYDPISGKRKRDIQPHWAHRLWHGKQPFHLSQCLFGEHQLNTCPTEWPIALVESEKTAMIMTAIEAQTIWLACGSLNGLSPQRIEPLKGRRVILYPDLGGYELWFKKAMEFNQQGYYLAVSDLLERKSAPADREGGFDIADYFLKVRDEDTGLVLTDGIPAFW